MAGLWHQQALYSYERIGFEIQAFASVAIGAVTQMGFIKKLFGGLFALLGALFGGIGGLLGLGKKSEFFLEADGASEAKAAPVAKAAKVAKAEKVEAPAAKPAKVEAVAPATASSNGKVAPTAPAAPAPVAAPVAVSGPKTFAPNFLTNTSAGSRRRPGPSLNPYMDMAKKMKTQA